MSRGKKYHVETVLDKKITFKNKKRQTFYLIKWLDYPIEQASWVAKNYMDKGCQPLIDEFNKRLRSTSNGRDFDQMSERSYKSIIKNRSQSPYPHKDEKRKQVKFDKNVAINEKEMEELSKFFVPLSKQEYQSQQIPQFFDKDVNKEIQVQNNKEQQTQLPQIENTQPQDQQSPKDKMKPEQSIEKSQESTTPAFVLINGDLDSSFPQSLQQQRTLKQDYKEDHLLDLFRHEYSPQSRNFSPISHTLRQPSHYQLLDIDQTGRVWVESTQRPLQKRQIMDMRVQQNSIDPIITTFYSDGATFSQTFSQKLLAYPDTEYQFLLKLLIEQFR